MKLFSVPRTEVGRGRYRLRGTKGPALGRRSVGRDRSRSSLRSLQIRNESVQNLANAPPFEAVQPGLRASGTPHSILHLNSLPGPVHLAVEADSSLVINVLLCCQ